MAKRIPEQVILQIKEANDLVSVVEQYVALSKKSSANYFGLCPFHSEDTPSFSVSPSKQIYYCFGCHKGGDVVNFIREVEHLDYPGALRFLAERAKISLPEVDDEAYQAERQARERLQALTSEAASYYYRLLFSKQGGRAQAYLHERGISAETAKRFALGYAGEAWDGLYRHLQKKGYDTKLLMRSGLFKQAKNGRIYDLFRERLIFPIFSPVGKRRVMAFGGRVLDDSLPKYINSPETELYHKGQTLYALDLAKKSAQKRFLLVEGYLDVISLHQAGFDQAVAPLGTALTPKQAKLLHQFSPAVTLAFDADKAGQAAISRSIPILEEAGLEIDVLQIPGAKDPDAYILEQGKAGFERLLKETLSVMDYRLNQAKQEGLREGYLDPERYLRAVFQFLPSLASESLKEIYLSRVAQTLGVSMDSVKRDARRLALSTQQTGGGQGAGLESIRQKDGLGAFAQRDRALDGMEVAQQHGAKLGSTRAEAVQGSAMVLESLGRLELALQKLLVFLSFYPPYQVPIAKHLELAELELVLSAELSQRILDLLRQEGLDSDQLMRLFSEPGLDAWRSAFAQTSIELEHLLAQQPQSGQDPRRYVEEELSRFFGQFRTLALQTEQRRLLEEIQAGSLTKEAREEKQARFRTLQEALDRLKKD